MRKSILTAVLTLTLIGALAGCSTDKSAAMPNRDEYLINENDYQKNATQNGSLTEDMKKAGEKVKDGTENAVNDMANGMKNAGKATKNGVEEMTRDVAQGAKNVGDGMANAARDVGNATKNAMDGTTT